MKKHLSNMLLILVLIVGLSLILYPTVSDHWNALHQSQAIMNYAEEVTQLDEKQYAELWNAAVAYNQKLPGKENPYLVSEEQKAEYTQLLNLSGTGIMGYIEVPKIGVSLPIYHGVSDHVLQVAIGHLEWTSLPTGGLSTHCVISGHRGLPSARLFTDLDRLATGDLFVIRVLDEILTYEVDQILVVEPDETKALLIEQGMDLCTLVTCTPYGVNTHRLLVRGHRVETQKEAVVIRVTADAMQISTTLVAAVLFIPLILLLVVWVFITSTFGKRKRGGHER